MPDLKPASVFLVGGAVRDHLLKRPCADLDLVCVNADGFAQRLADTCKASLVRFEKKPGEACFRVIDRGNPDNFIDLVELRNGNINADLARRDFTINAMAMPVEAGGRLGELIDPHSGLSDLNAKIVRMVGSKAFVNDPLRILRAWRFAAELGFRIEINTRKHLSDQTQRLKTVAAERVVYELFRILRVEPAGQFFGEMAATPILETLFPEKVDAAANSSYPVSWDNTLAVVNQLETILGSAATHFEDTAARVTENLRSGNRMPLLKLAAFYFDIGQLNAGMVEQIAEKVGRRLKISNRDRSLFQCLLTSLNDVFAIATGSGNRSSLIHFFKAREDDGVGALVLGLAILSANTVELPVGIERLPGSQILCKAIIAYYMGIRDKLAESALIVGKDLLYLGMSPGPNLGAVLREVRRAQDEGAVTTRSEALQWAHKFISPED